MPPIEDAFPLVRITADALRDGSLIAAASSKWNGCGS